jgi:hypothetical protein
VASVDGQLNGRDFEKGTGMALNVAQHLNKTVLVSIPALFSDGECRAYKLLGVELNGLWLQSDELTDRLLPQDRKDLASRAPMVFVPFAQIAGVLVAMSATPSSAQTREARAGPKTGSTRLPKSAPRAAQSSPRKPRLKKSPSTE